MFYQCAAVDEIEMKSKGIKRREWRIRLRSNNPRAWFEEHMSELFARVRLAQVGDRSGPVRTISLEAPDGDPDAFRVSFDETAATKRSPAGHGPLGNVSCTDSSPAVEARDLAEAKQIVEFHDHDGKVLHDEFLRWRRCHSRGFYLTIKSKLRANLHSVSCWHQGSLRFKDSEGSSATRDRKICANTRGLLSAWARRQGIEVTRCSHCL